MICTQKLEGLFRKFDEVLYDYEIYNDAEVFRTLNAYQNSRLEKIEQANNDKHRVALHRTLDYFDMEFIEKYKKSKNKEKLLHKLVNSFVLQVPNINYINDCTYSKYMFNEIVSFKSKILGNVNWYLRIIPESAWLITYLKELKDESVS